MDWITHAAVGAALGELMLGTRLGNRALGWGLLLGVFPDLLDALLALFLSTSGRLAQVSAASHSPLLMLALLLVLPRNTAKLWRQAKVTRGQAGGFVALAWSVHLLVDALSLPGVQVLWPYPGPRVGIWLLDRGDGLFVLPMAVMLLSLVGLRSKKEQAKRRRRWWWGVGLSGGYLVLAGVAKWAVAAGFAGDLARRGITCERRMESPFSCNLLLWRGLAECGDDVWVGYRSVFEWRSTPLRWTVFPRQRQTFASVADDPDAKRVAAFAGGWWIARPNKSGVWLADLRGGECLQWGERKGMVDIRFRHAWQLDSQVVGDPLHPILAEPKNRSEMLRRLLQRSLAEKDGWQATPRLAGVPGAFPELLRVVE